METTSKGSSGKSGAKIRRSGVVLEIPTELIMVLKGQPREYFDQATMLALTQSINEAGQETPALVRPKANGKFRFELVDGERRFRACKTLGIPLKATVRAFGDEDEVFLSSVRSNFNRDNHDAIETCYALHRIRKMKRIQLLPQGDQVAAMARLFGKSEVWVWQHLGLARMPKELQDLMRADVPKGRRFPISLAAKLSGLDETDQLALVKEIREKRLPAKHAKRLVDKTIAGSYQGKRRGRLPSDEYGLLSSYLKRTGQDLAPFQELMAENKFEPMVDSRNILEQKEMSNQLGAIIKQLQQMYDIVYGKCGRMAG